MRLLSIFIIVSLVSCAELTTKKISILETTDVHGMLLPYDYIEKEKLNASLASVYSYIKNERTENTNLILLDNGDNLQGQPAVYYYNFIDTVSPHFLAEVMNYMNYDLATVGNHDIEAGHPVYDRLVEEYNFPLLAANAININTGKPYFKPYHIIKRNGIKIAVLGLVTPAIPNWLPEELYSGIEFKDMVETAKIWMPEILKEKPDLVVGLFHSGWDKSEINDQNRDFIYENGSATIAYNVPGFDVIFTGHDHRVANEQFVNIQGDTVLILNGGSHADNIALAQIEFTSGRGNNKIEKVIKGLIVNVHNFEPDSGFIEKFSIQDEVIKSYVNKVIGNSILNVSSRDAYFGPSSFVEMIHSVQLEITGADLSFAAPLSFDVLIPKGPVTVGDMFKLYRFENMLYTVSLSGAEIQKYLEFSYSLWLNTINGPDDIMLKIRTDNDGKPILTNGRAWLRTQPYNFDSASGIEYLVDISKPEGARVSISGFSDGRPFELAKMYRVAVNSYRGNGGGGHFSTGLGFPKDELKSRVIKSTDRDLRYYILKSIEEKQTINPLPTNNWKIIPEEWTKKIIPREYYLLFGTNI